MNVRKKIVLLHGLATTRVVWEDFFSKLEEKFDLLAPDQLGHGKNRDKSSESESAISYSPLDYAQDIIKTLEQKKFFPTWIVGHSMGGKTAAALVHLKPEWVQGLILVDIPPTTSERFRSFRHNRYRFYENLPMQFESLQQAQNYLTQECHDPSMIPLFMKCLISSADGKVTFDFDKGAVLKTLQSSDQGDVKTWIREAGERGVPILFIRGTESLLWSKEEYEADRQNYSDSTSILFTEISGAGHGLPLQKPKELLEDIIQFIGVPRSATD